MDDVYQFMFLTCTQLEPNAWEI